MDFRTLTTFFSFFSIFQLSSALSKESGSPFLTDTPTVHCQIQRLTFEIETKQPFVGRLFIRGHSNDKDCAVEFSSGHSAGIWNFTSKAKIEVDYNKCGMERIRSLSPKGVTYQNTIMVQFHRLFVTQGDKSFHVRCFYEEQQKHVTSDFDVSMVPTRSIERDMELPSCGYSIRAGTLNGPVVRSTTVGDVVYHRWECSKNMQVYGMLVHSCIIENEGGRQTLMVDPLGCATELDIVPSLTYNEDLNLAYTSSRVFKYPDNSVMRFRCQIRICTKLDNGCAGLTPPSCKTSRKIRSLSDSQVNNGSVLLTPNQEISATEDVAYDHREDMEYQSILGATSNLDVIANELFVLDEHEQRVSVANEQKLDVEEMQMQKQTMRGIEEEHVHMEYVLPDDPSSLSLMPKPKYGQRRQSSHTSFYDSHLIPSASPSPAPTSSSEQQRRGIRRGTDTATILEADNLTFTSDVHANYWELCFNRIILISILFGFVLFFLGSISFVVYILMERSNLLDIEEPKIENQDAIFNIITTVPNAVDFEKDETVKIVDANVTPISKV